MSALQLFFIALTLLAPPALWLVSRRFRSDRLDLLLCRVLAVTLVGVEITELSLKHFHEGMPVSTALPMQLCDWALLAVAMALWFRSQACFDVSYFWALAGTLQALFTPALDAALPQWRQAGFFFAHSMIVIGVFFLILVGRMRPRPRSLGRVLLWSEFYLLTALLVNAAVDENYGFLSHKPKNPSMLDWFSDTRWLYLVQINLTALVFFLALYAPWFVCDWIRARRPAAQAQP